MNDIEIKEACEKVYDDCLTTYKHVCFVGQGPNQTSWNQSLSRGISHYNATQNVNIKQMSQLDYATSFAVEIGKRLALTGSVGQKISLLLDVTPLEFYAAFRRENLNEKWNGKEGKGDKFNHDEGEQKAWDLMHDKSICKFVLLGQNVAKCFRGEWKLLAVRRHVINESRKFLMLPHPSGINTWYNSRDNMASASKALREFCFA